MNAPLPAESQAEKRTHFWPDASNGMRNRCEPNGGRSVAGTTSRPTRSPSPQTASTNSERERPLDLGHDRPIVAAPLDAPSRDEHLAGGHEELAGPQGAVIADSSRRKPGTRSSFT